MSEAPNNLARSIHRLVEASIGRVLTNRNVPREEWATVTSLNPLSVLPSSANSPVTVSSLIPVRVGDRVWVVFAGRAAVIVSAPMDSGWVKCTLNSGFTNPDTGVYCREINRVLYLTGRVTQTAGNFSTTALTQVGSLPSGYYPSHNKYYSAASATSISGVVYLSNAGAISIRVSGATASLDLSTMTPAPLDTIL